MSVNDSLVLTAEQKSVTLEQFAQYKNETKMSYDNLSIKKNIGNISYPVKNVLTTDYLNDLKSIAITVTLTDEQYNYYRFKPKLLANWAYGNSELHFILLALNNVASVKDFDFKVLKMLKIESIKEFVSAIYNSERDNISSS